MKHQSLYNSDFYKDGQAAFDFLSEQNISKQKTILYGESLGCGLAVKFSTEDIYNATILEAPYTSIADVAMRQYWYLPAKWLVLDRFDILSKIKDIKSPLLVIHGKKDELVPFDDINELNKRLSAQKGIKVEFDIITEANHFFSKADASLIKSLTKYIQKETALY